MDFAGATQSLFWFSHCPRLSMYGWIWVTVVWAIACVDVMAGKLEMALFWALTRPWRDQATRGTLKAVFAGRGTTWMSTTSTLNSSMLGDQTSHIDSRLKKQDGTPILIYARLLKEH